MKNSQCVTVYLDECAERMRLRRSDKVEDVQAHLERIRSDGADDLWFACLDAGWTVAELDAAYERRFGYKVRRV